MASTVNNITSATTTTALSVGGAKQTRFTFTGSYSGVTGNPQGSMDGTDFVNINGAFFREDTGAAFNGTVGSTNFSIVGNVGGWFHVRFNVTGVTGTVTVRGDTGTNLATSPGQQTISLNSVGQTITSGSATALAVGPGGTTNPSFVIDASAGSAETGWKVTAAAAAGGAGLAVVSSGANENGTINAKGTGTLTLQSTATGNIVLGAATTGSSLAVTGGLTSSGPTGTGIGYATGAGGTVTQITSITTGVTLNKLTGTITTVSATLAAGADASFTVTNSTVAATDTVVLHTKSYAGTADGIPICKVQSVAAGSFVVNVHNQGAVALDAVVVMSFSVLKGVAA